MSAQLAALAARLDALELKERVLLMTALSLVIALAWVRFGYEPLDAERRTLQANIASFQARSAETDLQSVQIIEAAAADPNIASRQRIAATDEQIAAIEADIRTAVGQLIPPEQMPLILRSVLEQTHGLAFAGLVGLGAEPLLDDADAEPRESSPANAYRHGFRISFKGSYLDTLAYLQALEALPWRFFWDSVDILVEEHPTATVSVVVYTLSVDRRWIGV